MTDRIYWIARAKELGWPVTIMTVLAVIIGAILWRQAHSPLDTGVNADGLYCTHHDDGEICTKARPQDRLQTGTRKPPA